jgi:cyclic pyranopterin phosphate synthase
MELTHVDQEGRARMVDVSPKPDTERTAVAGARVQMQPGTLAMIQANTAEKGDVLTVAQIAGIQAAKRTHELIPMCHPLLLSHMSVDLTPGQSDAQAWIDLRATVRTTGKTGVEMEALTAVSIAALTVYDMCKAVDRTMTITNVRLIHKSGGKSGAWNLEET